MMLSRRILLASIVSMLGAVACGNASFVGGGSARKTQTPSSPAQDPNGQSPNGPLPNGQTPGGPGTPGLPPGSQTPNGSNPGGQNPQIGPNTEISQPNANTVVFGQDRVFHIGDGDFDQTSCKKEVSELPLYGTAYFFQFEVVNDNTKININTAKICGTDYGTNTYELYSVRERIQSKFIVKNSSSEAGAEISLSRGVYMVVITSGVDDVNGTSDRDDFVVGNVTISGNQAVRPGKYGAFYR